MRVLVVGAGIGGMSAGIALDQHGIDVELIDIDPLWRVYGAGITIAGATLRAFSELGVYEELRTRGYVGHGIRVCSVAGEPLWDVPTPMPAEAGVAGCGGILRPVLHQILSGRILDAGIGVRLGISVDSLRQGDGFVDVGFSDGSTGRYDLVVGADGIYSRTRRQIFPDAPEPEYTGQSVWRILTDRPDHVDRRHYFLGGPAKVGFTPVSATQMYLFVAERTAQEFREPGELYETFVELLAGYGGIVADIRAKVTPETEIVFRPLEAFHLPAPWHSGRVALIGDAAHPTTPQLASGAGIAVEDALVLAEELASHGDVPAALNAFLRRREERCRYVVDSSIEIGRLEQEGAPPEQQTAVVERALAKLAEPI
ncbi:FAD-dependent monooxygenase [Kribbella sp. NPDC058245]|uniref:FAD-dependent monooxygenase n=1 Tax=Kribbella sp. NPDC058245 TaxID=3346399 RepID=UPI0036EA4A7D